MTAITSVVYQDCVYAYKRCYRNAHRDYKIHEGSGGQLHQFTQVLPAV